MAKNEKNIADSERFIREIYAKHFKREINEESLREAALRLCQAVPSKKEAA